MEWASVEREGGGYSVRCTVHRPQSLWSLLIQKQTQTEEDARERLRRINNKVCRRVAVREWVTIVTKTLKEGSTP